LACATWMNALQLPQYQSFQSYFRTMQSRS
jgi:hypothetical protein